MNRWTPEEDARIAELFHRDYQNWEIADDIGTHSTQRVGQRLCSMGLFRGSDECERCKAPLVQPRTGRKRKFCSDFCRTFLPQSIPESYEIECVDCGANVVVHSAGIKTCEEHRGKAWAQRRSYVNGTSGFGHYLRKRGPHDIKCVICGVEVKGAEKNVSTCPEHRSNTVEYQRVKAARYYQAQKQKASA